MTQLSDQNVEEVIAETAKRVSNWNRWGVHDVLGTLNFIDDAKRARAVALAARGAVFSLACPFDRYGPQSGRNQRINPIHTMTMLMTGDGAVSERTPLPLPPNGIGGADDVVFMPLQCSTHWDGLGHIFDHGVAWNGRSAKEVVSCDGDAVTGIEHTVDKIVTRGVLLDVGRAVGNGQLDDGFAITSDHLEATIAAQGPSANIQTGDIVLVRTGQLARCRASGWGTYAGGDAPGLAFNTVDWIYRMEIAGLASDTWGVEVRPNQFSNAVQPWHQIAIPHLGLMVGEMFDLESLASDCQSDGIYEFLLVATPLPVTGAVGAPVVPIAIK